jgi:hypothetical protein
MKTRSKLDSICELDVCELDVCELEMIWADRNRVPVSVGFI